MTDPLLEDRSSSGKKAGCDPLRALCTSTARGIALEEKTQAVSELGDTSPDMKISWEENEMYSLMTRIET